MKASRSSGGTSASGLMNISPMTINGKQPVVVLAGADCPRESRTAVAGWAGTHPCVGALSRCHARRGAAARRALRRSPSTHPQGHGRARVARTPSMGSTPTTTVIRLCAHSLCRTGRASGTCWFRRAGHGGSTDRRHQGPQPRCFFQRWRPTNTEYVYGRRHKPYGNKNFPSERLELDRLVVEADREHSRDCEVAGGVQMIEVALLTVALAQTPPEDRPVLSVRRTTEALQGRAWLERELLRVRRDVSGTGESNLHGL